MSTVDANRVIFTGENSAIRLSNDDSDSFTQGCSTLSTEVPVEERFGSGESRSISILTEC